MMCLTWNLKEGCYRVNGEGEGEACPSALWWWLAAAATAGAVLFQRGKAKRAARGRRR